jgi:hypothetical protein
MISMMKPKGTPANHDGLLEYLEDIIGSDKYIKPIEEAGTKVDALNEVRQEKLNRVKIVEKEKDSLEGPKNEAEAYLVKEIEVYLALCYPSSYISYDILLRPGPCMYMYACIGKFIKSHISSTICI